MGGPSLLFAKILLQTSWKDRAQFAVSQAGMVNNLNDAMIWGLAPIFLSGAGLQLKQVALVAAVYPGVWGFSQLFTGALSDRLGRKRMIVMGMWIQAIGIAGFVLGKSFIAWLAGSALLGIGTGLVYPTLLDQYLTWRTPSGEHRPWGCTVYGAMGVMRWARFYRAW